MTVFDMHTTGFFLIKTELVPNMTSVTKTTITNNKKSHISHLDLDLASSELSNTMTFNHYYKLINY